MKYILFICFVFFVQHTSAQQVEIIRLDSCQQMGAHPFDDVLIRVQEAAKWNLKKTSLDDYLDQFFKPYVQKRAGGKITLSLLINTEGKACLYEARPNTNVRPDFQALKNWMNQSNWTPAQQNGQSVISIKILLIQFEGKKINVTELD